MTDAIDDQIKALQQRAEALKIIKGYLDRDPQLAAALKQMLAGLAPTKALVTQKGSVADAIREQFTKNGNQPLTIANLVERTGRDKGAIRQVLYRVQKAKFKQHKQFEGRETGFTLKSAPKK